MISFAVCIFKNTSSWESWESKLWPSAECPDPAFRDPARLKSALLRWLISKVTVLQSSC